MVALVAVTAAVAVALNGQPFPAACFAVLVCLMVAPANMFDVGMLSAVPPIAAAFLASPGLTLDPALTRLWALLGGLFVVLLLARVAPPDRRHPIGAVTAFRHATVMAVAMGVSVFLVLHFEVPHGYWVPMTMALVLQPFGAETTTLARQRIVGTHRRSPAGPGAGPGAPDRCGRRRGAAADGARSDLLDARPVLQVGVVPAPSAVLLANLASQDAEISATLHRLVATLVGGIVAAGLALLLEHADTEQTSPADSEPSQVD